MASQAIITWNNAGLKPVYDADQAKVQNVKLPNSVSYPMGTILGEVAGVDAVQTLTPGGTISGGTYTITCLGQTTAAIAFGASATAVQQALEALSSVGVGGVVVTGGPTNTTALVLTFSNQLGKQPIATVSITSSLTGSSPTLTPSSTTTGVVGTYGLFKQQSAYATDGSQIAKGLLQFQCTTDSSGNITYGAQTGGGEFGQTYTSAPAFFSGTFNTADLNGITEQILAQMNGRYVSGSIAHGGVIRIP